MDECVYVIGAPGSNTVKIGRTNNIQKRVGEIQRMSPVPLDLLWSHPGNHELETRLHRQFSASRVHGEWFSFHNDPVGLVRWAVEHEPWLRPKVSLKKRVPPAKKRPIPALHRPAPMTPDQRSAWQARFDAELGKLSDQLDSIKDPAKRYKALVKVRAELKETFQRRSEEAALGLKEQGHTWREIGALLGVSGQRAHQIANRQHSGKPRSAKK